MASLQTTVPKRFLAVTRAIERAGYVLATGSRRTARERSVQRTKIANHRIPDRYMPDLDGLARAGYVVA